MPNFVCLLCEHRKFRTIHSYLLHLRIRHANDANFRITCGISECKSEYDKYASLYKHICRNHKDVFGELKDHQVTNLSDDNDYHMQSNSGDELDVPKDLPRIVKPH